jgi:hypothetical protein
MTRAFILVLTVCFAGASGSAQDKTDTPPKMLAEALARRIGTWDTQSTIKPGVWNPDGTQTKGVETIDWALGKKFIHGKQKRQPGNAESMFIETYDTQDGVFRSWYFDSDGNYPRNEMIGRWDEKTKTMTYKGTDPAGVTALVVLRFADPDRFDWEGTWRDKSGKVLMEMVGKATRRR